MTRRLREHGLALGFAGIGVWVMVYLGLYGFAWTDYDSEVTPSYDALTAGHVWRFFELAPAYGGSLELRAPFALLPGLWGGGEFSVYRVVALPCLLAGALLAVWLCAQMRRTGATRLARGTALALCAANPITVQACVIGHPEELLGAVLVVAAVLVAQASSRSHTAGRTRRGAGRQAMWAGALLGLAIVNKEWALLAVGPVLVALPSSRWRALAVAGGITALFYAPLVIAQFATSITNGALVTAHTGTIFLPWQAWWFFGTPEHAVLGGGGVVHANYRAAPGWLSGVAHPLIIVLGAPLTLLAVRAARRRRPAGVAPARADALLLLALLLLVRCVLDPWDNVYYLLPFIITLLTWEALSFRRPPLFALLATVATWVVFEWVPARASPDVQSAMFLALALPTLAGLAVAIYRPAPRARTRADLAARALGRRARSKPLLGGAGAPAAYAREGAP